MAEAIFLPPADPKNMRAGIRSAVRSLLDDQPDMFHVQRRHGLRGHVQRDADVDQSAEQPVAGGPGGEV